METKETGRLKARTNYDDLHDFIERTAKDVFDNLSDKDREYLCAHPSAIDYHFSLGMGIRNKYIYPSDIDFQGIHPDDLSHEIVNRVISMAVGNYDVSNPFFPGIYNNQAFCKLRRLYHVFFGKYPDEIMAEFAREEDKAIGVKKCIQKLSGIVLNEERTHAMCVRYGVSEEEFLEFKEYAVKNNGYEYNPNNFLMEMLIGSFQRYGEGFVPYDLAALGSDNLPKDEREKLLTLLKAVLEDNYGAADNMPAFVFNQKDAVLVTVSDRGMALKRFQDFNTDDDVIRTALKQYGEALEFVGTDLKYNDEYVKLALSDQDSFVLGKPFMERFRDSDEWVRLAVEANGSNIIYASDRLRDDYEMAKAAILNQRNTYVGDIYQSLSPRLKDDKSLAIIDIQKGKAEVQEYSERLRDDDEIAEALIDAGHEWGLFEMSPRIQKKYHKYMED